MNISETIVRIGKKIVEINKNAALANCEGMIRWGQRIDKFKKDLSEIKLRK